MSRHIRPEKPDPQLQGQGVNPVTANAQNLNANVDQPDRLYVGLASQHLYGDYKETDTQELSGGSCGHALYIEHTTEIHDLDWPGGEGANGTAHYSTENTTEDGTYNQTEDDVMMWPENQYGFLDWGLVDQTNAYWDTFGTTGYTNGYGPYLFGPPLVAWEHCDVTDPYDFEDSGTGNCGAYHTVRHEDYERCAVTFLSYFTGGKAIPHKQNVIEFYGWADHLLVRRDQPQDPGGYHDALQVEIPPTKVAIGGQGYLGSDHLLYKVLPDGATVDVTPTVKGDDFYWFDVQPTKYTPVHLTECTAAGNTNNARTTIGIGEVVDFSGMPANTTWTVSGAGSLSSTVGDHTTFTASHSPGGAMVTAKVGMEHFSLSVSLSVIPPSGLDASDYVDLGPSEWPSGTDEIGADTKYRIQLLPTSVSFGNATIREEIQPTYRTWPDGEESMTKGETNSIAGIGCDSVFTDHISDGLIPVYRLSNGNTWVNKSFTRSWVEKYENENGDWVYFADVSATVEFRGSDRAARETYQGLPGGWQGPWQ